MVFVRVPISVAPIPEGPDGGAAVEQSLARLADERTRFVPECLGGCRC